ncbi:SulP family inorganic anion transporter [Mycobacterium canetti]|uniref:SulP family inorganic anion transporter n=1 Tax=Mycobacterium canetti TaxID=78331 RepID=UPI001CD71814|nr:SulP family inorganic anion transporter [Mycobacterium canetti]
MSPGGQPWSHEISAIALGVLTIALIASVESLLSAVGVDKLHHGPRTDFNREMVGRAARTWCPDCSAAAHHRCHRAQLGQRGRRARTRNVTVLHGVWILLFASLFTNLVN